MQQHFYDICLVRHLKNLGTRPLVVAILASWGIAFFEYVLQVPANRIGNQVMSLGQLKILQEVITLSVFVPFAVYYMKEKLTWDYLGRACACWARHSSFSAASWPADEPLANFALQHSGFRVHSDPNKLQV